MRGISRGCGVAALVLLAGCAAGPPVQTAPAEPTLGDLAGGALLAVNDESSIDREQAIRAYRDYLQRYPASAERDAIRRRLADLLLESAADSRAFLSPATAATAPEGGTAETRYREAIALYEELLRDQPQRPDRAEILYQLSRASEEAGEPERALQALDTLITQYPAADERLYADARFRRGELQFDAGDFHAAVASYREVVDRGVNTPAYAPSLYKLGWSLFKLERYEAALDVFFELLDFRLPPGVPLESRLAAFSRPEQEQLADVFRAISLCFSYLDGADSIAAWFRQNGERDYEARIYRNLAGLYDDKRLYTDAAQTRLALAGRVADDATAARLHIEAIGIYQQAGFRERLMETHAAFIGRYGPGSDFRARQGQADLPDVIRQVQSSLSALAQHYHARYLEERAAGDYRDAASRYRQYLQAFPGAEDAADMAFGLGELLYAGRDNEEATAAYERVAYESAPNPHAAQAGLNAVLACERHLQQAGADEREGRQSRCDALAVRFIGGFPQHPAAVAVLTRTGAGMIDRQQAGEAARTARALLERGQSVPPALRQAAWLLLAQAQFSLGDYPAAEAAYREALSGDAPEGVPRDTLQEAMATAIYRRAEQQRAAGDSELAAGTFLRAATAAPGSSLQAMAQYDAAASLLAAGRWDAAARVLEQFRADQPGHELQPEVTRRLAFAHAQAGRDAAAAREYARLAGQPGDEALRREALLQAADLYEQAGRSGDAVGLLERYLARYPRPAGEAAAVMQRLAAIEAASGEAQRQRYWLEALVRLDASAGDADTRQPAAQARLALADHRIAGFARLSLGEPLQQRLADKLAAMQLAVGELEAAAGYGITAVTTAATYRTGQLYQDLGGALLASSRPPGLDPGELARYELLLEQEAAPFEDKAIEFYEANLDLLRAGYHDEWVALSLERLAVLWPARYARQEHLEVWVNDKPAGMDAAAYRRAMEPMQAQRYAAAIDILEPLVQSTQSSPALELNLAIAYARQDRAADAANTLQRVLAVRPDSAVAHNLHGVLQRRAGRLQQAQAAYAEALRLRPGYAMAHINLGILCDLYLQNPDCAMQHYREYLQLAGTGGGRVDIWLADLEQRHAHAGD